MMDAEEINQFDDECDNKFRKFLKSKDINAFNALKGMCAFNLFVSAIIAYDEEFLEKYNAMIDLIKSYPEIGDRILESITLLKEFEKSHGPAPRP